MACPWSLLESVISVIKGPYLCACLAVIDIDDRILSVGYPLTSLAAFMHHGPSRESNGAFPTFLKPTKWILSGPRN